MSSARDFLVQCAVTSMESGSFPDLLCTLKHPVGSGNTLLAFVNLPSAAGTPTITDDGTNTWSAPVSVTNATSGQSMFIWIASNITNAPRHATISFGSAQATYSGGLIELCHIKAVSPLDTSATGSPNGTTTVSTGALTPTTAGDLILHLAAQVSVAGWQAGAIASSFSPGTTEPDWELVYSQTVGGSAAQFRVHDGTASVTPTITCGTSFGWCTIALALKVDLAVGTPMPTNVPRVRRRIFHSVLDAATPNPITLQQPDIGGGLLALSILTWNNDSISHAVTSILSSNNRANIQAGVANFSLSGGSRVDNAIWYDPCIDSAHPTLTVTLANPLNSGGEFTCEMVEWCNVDPTQPLGVTFTNSGNETSTNSLEAGSYTPQQVNSGHQAAGGIDTGTAKETITPNTSSSTQFYSTGMVGGFNTLEEDNPHGVYVNSSLAAIDWKWNVSTPGGTASVGNWGLVAVEFKSPKTKYRVMPQREYNRRRRALAAAGIR